MFMAVVSALIFVHETTNNKVVASLRTESLSKLVFCCSVTVTDQKMYRLKTAPCTLSFFLSQAGHGLAGSSASGLTGCSQGADQFAFSSWVLLASLLAEFRFWYCGTELWAPRRHPSPQAAHGSGCGERLFWMVPSS